MQTTFLILLKEQDWLLRTYIMECMYVRNNQSFQNVMEVLHWSKESYRLQKECLL